MREIKFRAWDKERKAMFNAMVSLHFDDGVCAATFISNLGDEKTVPIDGLELMQFTGLLDKNGKEIYEGDVCRMKADGADEPENWTITFDSGRFAGVIPNDVVGLHYFTSCEMEVIGNIYENPELLR